MPPLSFRQHRQIRRDLQKLAPERPRAPGIVAVAIGAFSSIKRPPRNLRRLDAGGQRQGESQENPHSCIVSSQVKRSTIGWLVITSVPVSSLTVTPLPSKKSP